MRRAVTKAGIDPEKVLCAMVVASANALAGERCVDAILTTTNRPTAIFCVNDLLALGVMRGLSQRGVSIPNDITVIGYDDVEFAAMLSPALTSIRQPKYQLGRAAADLLLHEIGEAAQHQHAQVIYQPELIVRNSTVPLPEKSLPVLHQIPCERRSAQESLESQTHSSTHFRQ